MSSLNERMGTGAAMFGFHWSWCVVKQTMTRVSFLSTCATVTQLWHSHLGTVWIRYKLLIFFLFIFLPSFFLLFLLPSSFPLSPPFLLFFLLSFPSSSFLSVFPFPPLFIHFFLFICWLCSSRSWHQDPLYA